MQRRKADEGSVTVADVYELHPDEWVLMEITHPHGDYRRERGRVLAHSRNRDDLLEPRRSFRAEHPKAPTFEFYAGEVVPEGVVFVL